MKGLDGVDVMDLVRAANDVPDERQWAVTALTLRNSGMNLTLLYGSVHGAPYGQAVLEKPGGSIVVPYCQHPTTGLLIGLVRQKRPLQNRATPDKPVLNLPRGFRLPNETHDQTAQRESLEETGYLGRTVPFDCPLLNIDNALITYTCGSGGEKYYHLQVQPDELTADGTVWKFRPELVKNVPKGDEKIVGSEFHPVATTHSLQCHFTQTAVAMLERMLLTTELEALRKKSKKK